MDVIKRKNKIILFYSPQGGTGKSTIAVNMAICLAKQGLKILLVDMAVYGSVISSLRIPQKGDIGLSSIITLLDLDIKTADTPRFMEVLKSSIVKIPQEANLDILPAANPIKMEAINESYANAIMNGLKNLNYDVIIIDTSSELSEKNIILLEKVNYTILPATQDISCGWKLVLFREIMERYMIEADKFRIVINKCSKYSGFNNMEFENEIGYKIIGEIPLCIKKFQNYINQGLNIYSMPNRTLKKNFSSIVKSILESVV